MDQLLKESLITKISDIYNLTVSQLAELERMGQKSAYKIIEAIDKSKQTTFARFVHALGIRNVGINAGKILEKAFFGDFNRFQQCSYEQLVSIDEIGHIMAQSIQDFLHDDENKKIINSCIEAGITFETYQHSEVTKLSEKTFVFTGSLTKFTREEAKRIVEKMGGKAMNSVSPNTDYLVAGPGAGSKLKKAQILNITVLDENEFLDLCRS